MNSIQESRGETAWEIIFRMRKENQRWTNLSLNEKAIIENYSSDSDEDIFKLIKSNIRASTIEDLNKCFCKGRGILQKPMLKGYAQEAYNTDIRKKPRIMGRRYYGQESQEVILDVDYEERVILDAKAQEQLRVNPKLFLHNCTAITPKEKKSREWFRSVFDVGIESAETINDLLKLNNFDFRYIKGLTSPDGKLVFNDYGSSRLWFGKKSFYAYRERYMTKFLELAENATFEELWFVIDCFFDYKSNDKHKWREFITNEDIEEFEKCSPEHTKSHFHYSKYLKYLRYHKTKLKIDIGLPLKWILPLDQKCIEEIIRIALLKTDFEECLCVYKTRNVDSLKIQILEQLSDLASTPEEHFTVASIAHEKGESFNSLWKKHLILSAKALKVKN